MNEDDYYVDPSLDDYDIQKIEDKPKLTGVSIDINGSLTDSYRSDEPYGDWSESYYNFLGEVTLSDNHPDVVTNLDIRPGDDIFVVWAEWSTGDSFGNANCSQTEAFGVFKDYESACVLESFLEFSNNEQIKELFSIWGLTKDKADILITKFKPPFNITFKYVSENAIGTFRSNNGTLILTLHTPDGQQFEFTNFSWHGYFDTLETVYNSETTVLRVH